MHCISFLHCLLPIRIILLVSQCLKSIQTPLTLMSLAGAHAAYANKIFPAAQLCTCLQAQEQVKQLEVRRALDAEGWLSDVTILRKQLAAVDRKLHQMRLMDRLQVG